MDLEGVKSLKAERARGPAAGPVALGAVESSVHSSTAAAIRSVKDGTAAGRSG